MAIPVVETEAPPAPPKHAPTVNKQYTTVEKPYHEALKYGTLGCARKRPPTPEETLFKTHN